MAVNFALLWLALRSSKRDVRGRRDPGGYVKYLTREDREEPGGAAAGIKEKDYIMKLNRHIFKSCLLFTVTSLSIAAAFAQRPNDNPGEGDRAPDATSQTGGARSETLLDLYCGAGAIGLSMADAVQKVIGVEINRDAVKVNAYACLKELNAIYLTQVQDNPENVILGYEGSHFYKINGKYYIFFIHIIFYCFIFFYSISICIRCN